MRGPRRVLPPARAGSFLGASSPLPRVPAMVPSPSGLQTFTIVRDEERGRRREACPEEAFQLMSPLMEAISPLMPGRRRLHPTGFRGAFTADRPRFRRKFACNPTNCPLGADLDLARARPIF